jgi:hypothetical protein
VLIAFKMTNILDAIIIFNYPTWAACGTPADGRTVEGTTKKGPSRL